MVILKKRRYLNWGMFIIVTLISTILLQYFFLTSELIVGPSMKPNYMSNKHAIILKKGKIKRGSVIILQAPDKKDEHYIKRIIGMPGDKIVFSQDDLYINDKTYNEFYLKKGQKSWAKSSQKSENYTSNFQTTVPENSYFVMGDNRPVSNDSRSFGAIKRNSILGTVIGQY